MTHDVNILEAMTSLSMFKKTVADQRLWTHQILEHKVENLTNYPLESEKDRRYVAMFEKLLEFARARLECAKDKLVGWTDVSDVPNTKMEP